MIMVRVVGLQEVVAVQPGVVSEAGVVAGCTAAVATA